MTTPVLQRRDLFRMVGLSLASALPGAGLLACADPGEVVANDERALRAAARLAEILDTEPARRVGARYANDAVPDGDPHESARLLEPIIVHFDSNDSTEELAAALELMVLDDFVQARVHDLAGWTMSITEVQCAFLLYLVPA